MSAQAICVSYLKELLQGIHQPGDTYKLALFKSAANLDHATDLYEPTEESDGAGYAAGGKVLSGFFVGANGKTAFVLFDSPVVWAHSTITARYALVYNATQGNKAVAVIDLLIDRTSTAGNFRVDLPADGLIRITGP